MADGLRPYCEYKDSGLPWLGMIPVHWEIRRNGRLFSQRNQTAFADLPILEVSLRTGVRVRDFENSQRKQVMSDRDKYKRAAKGDIAYNMMRLWQGAIGVAPVDGLVSPAYVVARPYPEVDSRYYAYLFRTDLYMNEVNKYSHGIVVDRNRLYWDEFKQTPSVFPPPDEQRSVANFLDQHGRYVRQFIRNKQRLIELLNEQKQAIINQAVTRDHDPTVRLRPSGIEWLGEVPEHWQIIRLKHALAVPLKYGANLAAEDVDRSAPRYIRITDIDAQGNLIDDTYRSIPEALARPFLLQRGDILLARSGATAGKSYLHTDVQRRAAFAGYLIRARVDGRTVLPEYLYSYLQSVVYWTWIASITIQATIQNVSAEKYANLLLPLPPIDEQQAILRSIKAETLGADQLITRARREIEVIREYRTRLVADIVTGKLDVSGVAVPSWDESDLESTRLTDKTAEEMETDESQEQVGTDD